MEESGNRTASESDEQILGNQESAEPEPPDPQSDQDEPNDTESESEEQESDDDEDDDDDEDEDENDPNSPDRPSDNAAVRRCIRAWNRAHRKALNEYETDSDAKTMADQAYLNAMPPLAGYENIRDFIACVTYASVTDGIRHRDAEHLLDAAKVALATLCHQPKSSKRKPG
jgi:hypothetical protein